MLNTLEECAKLKDRLGGRKPQPPPRPPSIRSKILVLAKGVSTPKSLVNASKAGTGGTIDALLKPAGPDIETA